MLENLSLIAVVIVVLWVVTLLLYFWTSRQHHDLQNDIETVQRLLQYDERDDYS